MSVVEIDFPGNLASVSSITDLRAVPSSYLADGAAYLVGDAGVFTFDPGSTSVDDGSLVLKPNDRTPLQAGRWLLSGGSLFAPAAALSALAASIAAPDGSSKVGFKQQGTGATNRTIEQEARQRVTPQQFGAVGDGVADDTAAIQKAINSLVATGGTVRFPMGRYKVTSTITVSSLFPISLLGEMVGLTYDPNVASPAIVIGAAMAYVIKYEAPNSAQRGAHGAGLIRNLTFADPTAVNGGSPGVRTITACLYLKDFTWGFVENCIFSWLKGSAIRCEFVVQSSIKNCRIRYSGDGANSAVMLAGVSPTLPIQALTIDDCRIEVCYSNEYLTAVTECYDVTFRSIKFEAATSEFPGSSKKFLKVGATRYFLEGCSFNRTNAEAVEITINGRGKVVGCHFTTGASSANSLLIAGARNVVTGCIFEDERTDKSIEVTGAFNLINGNAFYTSGVIYCTGASNSITDNIINQSSKTGSGWAITVASNSVVSGNQLDDNGVSPSIGGIITYDNDMVFGNIFRRWTGQTAIRRESAGSVIFGNRFGSVGTAYTQSVGAAAGSGLTVNGDAVIGTQQAAIANDASGAANAAKLNAVLAALRAHGIIAT